MNTEPRRCWRLVLRDREGGAPVHPLAGSPLRAGIIQVRDAAPEGMSVLRSSRRDPADHEFVQVPQPLLLQNNVLGANAIGSTQKQYLKTCAALIEHFGRPAASLSGDEVRGYTEMLGEQCASPTRLKMHLCALLFLYRKTLGMPEHVAFITLRKIKSKVPDVLSIREVHALVNAITNRRYQALGMVMYGATATPSRRSTTAAP